MLDQEKEAFLAFLPEPLSELMLLELREDHVRRSGPPPQGPAMVGAAARPPPPRQATIPQTAVETQPEACRSATLYFCRSSGSVFATSASVAT